MFCVDDNVNTSWVWGRDRTRLQQWFSGTTVFHPELEWILLEIVKRNFEIERDKEEEFLQDYIGSPEIQRCEQCLHFGCLDRAREKLRDMVVVE